MPRVLRIINRLCLGGPTFNAALLTKHLAPEFETCLLAGVKEDTEESSEFILDKLGIAAEYVPTMHRAINPSKDYKAYQHIKQVIKRFKPDIVHTHAAKAGALGRLAAYECGVPVTMHTFHGHVFHSYFGAVKTQFYLEVERKLAKISNRIIAISTKQAEELGDVYKVCKKDKLATVPLGFDLSRFNTDQMDKRIDFRAKYAIADDEIAIGIVGRLVPIKNHGLFLRALQQVLSNTTKKIRAFIVGDGEERASLMALAQELGINFVGPEAAALGQKAPLTFTSWITAVDSVYAGVDVVALSSLNEGTPVTLIEAQAANKPIVTTNVGGVCDVVLPGKTALISSSKEVDAFAANLLKMVERDGLRSRLGKKGYQHVRRQYGYERLVGDISELYYKALWEVQTGTKRVPVRSLIDLEANLMATASSSLLVK